MRQALQLVLMLMLVSPVAAAPADIIHVELNAAVALNDQCRLSFVIQNKEGPALNSFKLDLVLFGQDGVIDRRLVAEMGPLRAEKTVVKTFAVESACKAIGSILVNDVTACAPGDAAACLDRLDLSSRVSQVRFFK
jgi:hypothetical protein